MTFRSALDLGCSTMSKSSLIFWRSQRGSGETTLSKEPGELNQEELGLMEHLGVVREWTQRGRGFWNVPTPATFHPWAFFLLLFIVIHLPFIYNVSSARTK